MSGTFGGVVEFALRVVCLYMTSLRYQEFLYTNNFVALR
jgi:hypothetical protein